MFVVFCVYVREGERNREKDREMEGWLLFSFLISKSEIGSVVKNLPASAGNLGSIPGLGRSPGGGNGNPLQYSCLENPMDRGAWQAIVHEVTKTWLNRYITTTDLVKPWLTSMVTDKEHPMRCCFRRLSEAYFWLIERLGDKIQILHLRNQNPSLQKGMPLRREKI